MCAVPHSHLMIIKDHVGIAMAEMQAPTATTPHRRKKLPTWLDTGIFVFTL